uniref:Putative secreted protein n=1 Tax=Anopheles triannulatus TaxID=58253 RepID=A0A2M4B6A7_9DIPT
MALKGYRATTILTRGDTSFAFVFGVPGAAAGPPGIFKSPPPFTCRPTPLRDAVLKEFTVGDCGWATKVGVMLPKLLELLLR